MKKVILSAYACSPIKGSEPGNGWSWAVNIAKLGYKVWCVTNNEDKDVIEEEVRKLSITNLHFVFVTVPYGLDSKLLDTSSKKIYLHYFLWRKQARKIAVNLHEEFVFDIAHHVTFGSLQQGTFLWKLKGVKLIFGPAGGGQEALPSLKEYFGNAWKMEKIRSRISKLSFYLNTDLKKTLEKSAHILVTNKETENLVKGSKYYDSSKVHMLLDNAVPPSMSNLEFIERDYIGRVELLWVGRMLPRKGLNLVLHGLSFLPPSLQFRLTIVGGGEQFVELNGWIAKYKLDSNKINILGQIPFVQVIDSYVKSDLFIFCSLRDSCPAQINEAMAFGLPAVVLNIHGSAIAVPDDCGIKVEAATAEQTARSIADAIIALVTDKQKMAIFSRNAYEYSKGNTWESKVLNTTSAYY